jgi:hypothetical protein
MILYVKPYSTMANIPPSVTQMSNGALLKELGIMAPLSRLSRHMLGKKDDSYLKTLQRLKTVKKECLKRMKKPKQSKK